MRIHTAFFFLLVMGGTCDAQELVTFRKTFGDTKFDFGHSVQQTTDGGYILFGLTTNDSSFNYDLYLIKTDFQGIKQWEKKYSDKYFQVAGSVQQTSDGGYIMCGAEDGYDNDSLTLIRTDASGIIQWKEKYRMSVSRTVGRYVEQTTDGGFVVTGFIGDGFMEDVYIVKTDANGLLQWSKTYGGAGREFGVCIRQANDGGYIVLGETDSFGHGKNDMYALRLDTHGDTLWTRTYGTEEYEAGYSLDLTSDGGFIGLGINGNNSGDLYLIKADADGNELWNKSYGGNRQDLGYAVLQTKEGGYFLAGRKTNELSHSGDMYAVKTDQFGEILWENVYPESDICEASSAQQTSDGGYIMLGSTTTVTDQGGTSDMYLVKIDSSGNTSGSIDPIENVPFTICPNPVFNLAYIKFKEPLGVPYTFLLYDAQGKQVREESGELFQQFEFVRGDLPSALYFFKILSNGSVLGKGKIIVQ